MWQRLPAFIREWPILIVGILLIVPLLYLSSFEASSSKSTASAPSLSRKDEPASRPTAADAPVPSAEPSSRPAPTPTKTAQDSAQAPAKAPAMSHDRMAAAPPAQTSGQGASAPTAAVAPVSRRRCRRQTRISQMPGLPFARTRQEWLGSEPCRSLIGKKAGGVSNYNYSPAMKGSNLTWDIATLDGYLSDPQKSVPGNKMPFPGLKTENERNAVIAYLAVESVTRCRSRAGSSTRRRRRRSERRPRQPLSRRPVTFPGCVTRCAQGLPKAAWSLSASAARSMDRSIRYCPQPKGRACRSP